MGVDNDLEAIRRLMFAGTRIDGAYYLYARRKGIKENALTLLYALDGGEPRTQTQLCAEWLIPKTTINTNVRELKQAGLVELCAMPHSREKAVRLTEKGKAFAEEVLKQVYEVERRAIEATLERYSREFVDAMDCFADALCAGFDREAGERPDGESEGFQER